MKDRLFICRLHPVPAACYFLLTAVFAVMCRHPAASVPLLLCGIILLALTSGPRASVSAVLFTLLTSLACGLINPLFASRGSTVLFYIGNVTYTAEAFFCGVSGGALLCSAVIWCRCMGTALNAEKLAWLCGRIAPRTSLVFSQTLGALPGLARKTADIDAVQQPLGLYRSEKLSDRIKGRAQTFSILITNSLEGSAETADSMLSRGWALPGHTCAARYRFGIADAVFSAAALLCTAAITVSLACGGLDFEFYPSPAPLALSPGLIAGAVGSAGLGFTAVIAEVSERISWLRSRSKI